MKREPFFYYRGATLFAVRSGPWKAHFITQSAYGQDKPTPHDPPELYHLTIDPREKFNVAAKNPDVVRELTDLTAKHKASFHPGRPSWKRPWPRSHVRQNVGCFALIMDTGSPRSGERGYEKIMIQIAMTAQQFLEQRSEMPEAGQWAELHAGVPVFLELPDVDHGTAVLNFSKALAGTFSSRRSGTPASTSDSSWPISPTRSCFRRSVSISAARCLRSQIARSPNRSRSDRGAGLDARSAGPS